MAEHTVEKDRMRGTGGNQFIRADANTFDLLMSIRDQLAHMRAVAEESGRYLDVGEVTISTRRIKDGRVSVSLSADLATAPIPPAAGGDA
jgi:hypothetical protein